MESFQKPREGNLHGKPQYKSLNDWYILLFWGSLFRYKHMMIYPKKPIPLMMAPILWPIEQPLKGTLEEPQEGTLNPKP